jgi:DNA (cytosine-5)-methyltransferase 1
MGFGSLFTGIGGFDLGFQRAGLKCLWQVENNNSCKKVLASHFKCDVYSDICNVNTKALMGPSLICGGFPCQDISVAGKRRGLAGKRSGLWWEFHRIIKSVTPTWVLIENVTGLLSSNRGRDLGTILGCLAELGYGTAYRVLDSQWFGMAQRRRRVFIVGCHGNWRGAARILFEPESLPWISPPHRQDAKCATEDIYGIRGDTTPKIKKNIMPTLLAAVGGERHCIASIKHGVRQVTPTEMERLQGFPDGWTSGHSKSVRYHMLGNAVTVPVAEWLGRRIG